jgi:hypothetical protein
VGSLVGILEIYPLPPLDRAVWASGDSALFSEGEVGGRGARGTNYHRGFRMPERERGLGGLRTGDFLGGCGVLRYNPLYRRISE